MIIKKIEINNFRSYYKLNVFELVNGLNLIIGSNGDGKTTFYEALEWLFRTDGSVKVDTKLISKKRSEELSSDESDEVRVSMTYEHKGTLKLWKKVFVLQNHMMVKSRLLIFLLNCLKRMVQNEWFVKE